jgi:multidrug efflux system outer membrane protein
LKLEPPALPVGLPTDLLRQRPDIAKAEHDLVAANASIGVATADLYPQLSLTGSAGFQNLDAGKIIDWPLRFWSIGAGLTAPIFEGGRLTAELEQAKARRVELEATFRSAVLGAIGDVETTLTDIHLRADAGLAQGRAVVSAREYLRLAELQYRQGVVGYLVVIDAERTLLSNELLLAQILDQRFTATVLLIKALGGGWSPALAAPPADQ